MRSRAPAHRDERRHADPREAADRALARLARSVEIARGRARALDRPVLAWATLPIPVLDLVDVFERSRALAADAVLWAQPGEGFGLVGVGAAWSVEADGPQRFSSVDEAWKALVADAVGEGPLGDARAEGPRADARGGGRPAGVRGAGPVAIGGFAFASDGPVAPEWAAFPAGALVVPRVTVAASGGGCWLTLAALVRPEEDRPPPVGESLVSILEAVMVNPVGVAPDAVSVAPDPVGLPPAAVGVAPNAPSGPAGRAAPSATRLVIEEIPAPEAWKAAVAGAARAVRNGAFGKVVLARAVRVHDGRLDPIAAVRRLSAGYPGCTVFAAARGEQCFLGATPERLVRLDGGRVRATALAGSAPRGTTDEDDRRLGAMLLASAKDRIEHALVVDALREALAVVCEELTVGPGPALLKVRNVQHLCTPVEGRLRDRRTVLDLVSRVHPTPAVGGFPRDAAAMWIGRHEGLARGWYAGPIGWMDAAGEGEFAVAIRSALVGEAEALLFAGCGIVGDSDPEEEYAESWLKLRPVLSALGGTWPDAPPGAPGPRSRSS